MNSAYFENMLKAFIDVCQKEGVEDTTLGKWLAILFCIWEEEQ